VFWAGFFRSGDVCGPAVKLKFDKSGAGRDIFRMTTATLKSELHEIADHLSGTASYGDVMYELYVRMKIDKGRQAAEEGRVFPHDDIKRRFIK
jgi:predicted transcriptional regulator